MIELIYKVECYDCGINAEVNYYNLGVDGREYLCRDCAEQREEYEQE